MSLRGRHFCNISAYLGVGHEKVKTILGVLLRPPTRG